MECGIEGKKILKFIQKQRPLSSGASMRRRKYQFTWAADG